jgi:hypothetical protein
MFNSYKQAIIITIHLILTTKPILAETIIYRGTGTYTATQVLMPLANGDAAVHLTNNTVATLEPSESGFMTGQCAGLGFLAANGSYQADLYCTFAENEENRLNLKGVTNLDLTKFEVIGGTGKWQNATGIGTLRPKFVNGNRGSYDYELQITIP